MSRIQMSMEEFHAVLKAQGAPSRESLVFKCPICGTMQSIADFVRVGAVPEAKKADGYIGFSCIGRFTNAGPFRKGKKPGLGCDWTLGGLFQCHELEVVTEDGVEHPHFMPATPSEAAEHWKAVKSDGAQPVPAHGMEVGA